MCFTFLFLFVLWLMTAVAKQASRHVVLSKGIVPKNPGKNKRKKSQMGFCEWGVLNAVAQP